MITKLNSKLFFKFFSDEWLGNFQQRMQDFHCNKYSFDSWVKYEHLSKEKSGQTRSRDFKLLVNWKIFLRLSQTLIVDW